MKRRRRRLSKRIIPDQPTNLDMRMNNLIPIGNFHRIIIRRASGLGEENTQNEYNPYYEFFNIFSEPESESSHVDSNNMQNSQSDVLNNFFSNIGGMGSIFSGAFMGNPSQRGQVPPNAPNAGVRADRENRGRPIPHGLFGSHDFVSFVNGNQFGNFGTNSSSSIDPAMFMDNFHANFRSSNAFTDLLNRTAEEHQASSNPASREAVSKLPIVIVDEKHCKKIEGKEQQLEPPSCPVCIDEISIGKEAMFMP